MVLVLSLGPPGQTLGGGEEVLGLRHVAPELGHLGVVDGQDAIGATQSQGGQAGGILAPRRGRHVLAVREDVGGLVRVRRARPVPRAG